MGRHRKRQRRHPRRVSRRIALVSAGLLVPMTGGAVVFAATNGPTGPPPYRSASADHAPARRSAASAPSHVRPPARAAAASSSPLPRTAPTASADPAPTAPPLTVFAPYADVLSWPPPDLSSKAHAEAYTMGFVAADGGCSAAWDGLSPVDAASAIHRVKDVPGKVIVSFGGPHDVELAQICQNVDDLAEQYRKAIDATHPSAIDFYLPEGALTDTASVRRRTEALARVQQGHDRPLSITLPLHRSGLSANALGMLSSAARDGLQVPIVNLVTAGIAGPWVTAAATAAHGQLQRLYHQSDAQVWQRMGITPVIGVGLTGAPFRPADARQVLAWATAHGLGRLSMWSVTRDTPCTTDTSIGADTCSGLDEDTGVFSQIFEGF